jgi:hypothetical protein
MISVTDLLAHSIENGLTVYFNYEKSNPSMLRSGVPLNLINNGKTVTVRIEIYLPYRRYEDQLPAIVEYKNFTVSHIKNLCVEYSNEDLEEMPVEFNISSIEDIELLDVECEGCKYDMPNQQAHYGGCIKLEGDYF